MIVKISDSVKNIGLSEWDIQYLLSRTRRFKSSVAEEVSLNHIGTDGTYCLDVIIGYRKITLNVDGSKLLKLKRVRRDHLLDKLFDL